MAMNGFNGTVQFAIEHGPFIVDLPFKDGDFSVRKLLVYQRAFTHLSRIGNNFVSRTG